MTIYTDFVKKHHDHNKLNRLFKLSVTNHNEITSPSTLSDDSISSEDHLKEEIEPYESNLIYGKDNTSICNQTSDSTNTYSNLIGWTAPDEIFPIIFEPVCEEIKVDNNLDFSEISDITVINPNETLPQDLNIDPLYNNNSIADLTISILSSDEECMCLSDIKPFNLKIAKPPLTNPTTNSRASKKVSKRTNKYIQNKGLHNQRKGKSNSLQELLHSIRNDTNELLNCPLTSPIAIAQIEENSKRQNPRTTKKSLSNLNFEVSHIEEDFNNDEIICEAIPSIRFMVRFMGNNNKIYPLDIKNNERMEKLLEAICTLEPSYSPHDLKLQRRDQDVILFQTPETLKLAPGTFLECLEIPGRSGIQPQASTSAAYFTSHLNPLNAEAGGQVEICDGMQHIKLKVQYMPSNNETNEAGLNKAAKVPRAALEYERSMGLGQKLSKLVEAFSAYAGLNPKKLKLSFDGSTLDLETTIGEAELEDGDVLDALSA